MKKRNILPLYQFFLAFQLLNQNNLNIFVLKFFPFSVVGGSTILLKMHGVIQIPSVFR